MKKIKISALALCSLLVVSCATNQGTGALAGAGGGAVLGGIIGNIIGKDSKATAIGAAIGGAVGSGAGALIGHHMDKVKQQAQAQLDNAKVDSEAIKVEMPGIGQIGYVANSPYTVIGESYSAGRIYDKIDDEAYGTVLYVLPRGVLCKLKTDE